MTARPWMPLYIADYLADTQHLDATEHGAYLLLLMHCWQHLHVQNDMQTLRRIARVSTRKWNRTWSIIGRFFETDPDGYLVQKRLAAELRRASDLSNKRKDAALQMHKKRAANAHANAHAHHGSLQPELQTHARATPQPHPQPHKGGSKNRTPFSARKRAVRFDDWPADFHEQFWDAYPNKKNQPEAFAALDAKREQLGHEKRVQPWSAVMDGIANYVETKPFDRHWMNPKTFIEGERWNDRPGPPTNGHHAGANGRSGDTAARLAREAEERERSAENSRRQADRIGGAEIGGDHARDVSRSR